MEYENDENELVDDYNEETERLDEIADKTAENYYKALENAKKNSDFDIAIDNVIVYITLGETKSGKTQFSWFTLHKLSDEELKQLEINVHKAMDKIAKNDIIKEGNKWSLPKRFSQICSTIANTLKRSFRI